MRFNVRRHRPEPWAKQKESIKRAWIRPFWAVEWILEWMAYFLSNWAFLEVLEYLGSFGVLIAVIFYFSESGNRIKQRHNQAWQVINTAQGKGGSGGRIEALQELNADEVPLVGVDVSGAYLQGLRLNGAHLTRSNFSAADVRNSEFAAADFSDADLHFANFRQSNLRQAMLQGANLDDADLAGVDLSDADVSHASLASADLRKADLRGVRWREIKNIKLANIYGVRNAPDGFVVWAVEKGAVQIEADSQWQPLQ